MNWLVSSVAALTLLASGASWAGETGGSQGSQAKKPFKSSETMEPSVEEQSSQGKGDPQAKSQKPRQSTGGYMDDALITAKVKAALAKDPGA